MAVMWGLRGFALVCAALFAPVAACADVITALPTQEKVVALTFDACEQGKPVAFDRAVLDYLLDQRIPFTVFVTGRFVQSNTEDVAELAKLDFVEIENHSFSHPNHMEKLSLAKVRDQIVRAHATIEAAIGRKPLFFRFPAGNYNAADLKLAEDLGYKVVHWSWATGDPDPAESRNALVRRVQTLTQPGNILIFHINGRGVHTAEALPIIIDDLRKRGFRFAKLSDYLGDHAAEEPAEVSLADHLRQFLALMYFKQTAPVPAATAVPSSTPPLN
jgi:peptidoglycan/xylan/chitin deacetylase (PgdA/CDA1 family)